MSDYQDWVLLRIGVGQKGKHPKRAPPEVDFKEHYAIESIRGEAKRLEVKSR